jgi:hypothetical protein
VLLGLEAMTVYALLLQGSDDALEHSVLLRTVRRDELLPEAITAHEARIGPRGEHQPVVGLSRNGVVTRPSVPNLAINACSSADTAVVARPLLESCQPSSSRV